MNWLQRKIFNFFWKRFTKRLPSKEVVAKRIADVSEVLEMVQAEREKRKQDDLIHAPYIPEVVVVEFSPKKGLASRYATKMINSKFYGVVQVTPETIKTVENDSSDKTKTLSA